METNLARLAEAALERSGDYPSLHYGGEWFSSVDLHERATRVASGLRAAGVAPGDRVVVIMANCPEVVVTYHALWRAGAVITPVVFLVTAPELRHIIGDSGAVAVVTTAELAPKVAAAQDGARPAVAGVRRRRELRRIGGGRAQPDDRPHRRRPRRLALHRRHDRPQQRRLAQPRQPVPRRCIVALGQSCPRAGARDHRAAVVAFIRPAGHRRWPAHAGADGVDPAALVRADRMALPRDRTPRADDRGGAVNARDPSRATAR